jgi:hypothetical protein
VLSERGSRDGCHRARVFFCVGVSAHSWRGSQLGFLAVSEFVWRSVTVCQHAAAPTS